VALALVRLVEVVAAHEAARSPSATSANRSTSRSQPSPASSRSSWTPGFHPRQARRLGPHALVPRGHERARGGPERDAL